MLTVSMAMFGLSTWASAAMPPTVDVVLTRMSPLPATLDYAIPVQIVSTNPVIRSCRFDSFQLLPTAANQAALKAQIASYVTSGARVTLTYRNEPSGECSIQAIAAASSPGGRPDDNRSNPPVSTFDGYHNKHAAAYPKAFRDFGQGTMDEKVDPISGHLTITMKELVIPGPNGLDIRVMRKYTSPDPKTMARAVVESYSNYVHGIGWTMFVNVGGLRGAPDYCPVQVGVGYERGFLPEAFHSLPTWVNEDGNSEAMVYDTDGYVSASGVRVPCAQGGRLSSTARYPDGTKVDLLLVAFSSGGGTSRVMGVPKRIEDRWGNWIAVQYVGEDSGFLLQDDADGVPAMWSVPISKITSSDGRVVDFEYASGDPAWLPGMPRREYFLKTLRYGQHQINYEMIRKVASAGGMAIAKYFLAAKVADDGKRHQFDYYFDGVPWFYDNAVPDAIFGFPESCRMPVGVGVLRSLTHPAGGMTTFTWVASERPDPKFVCGRDYILPRAMLRTRTTSDGGVWRYSYSDMSSSVTRVLPDDAPPAVGWYADPTGGANGAITRIGGANKVNFEWGRVSGPTKTVMSYHHDRFGVEGPINQNGDFRNFLTPILLGRAIVVETYSPGAAPAQLLRSERHAYTSAFSSSIPLYLEDYTLFAGGINYLQFYNAAITWPMERIVTLGTSTYSTKHEYQWMTWPAYPTLPNYPINQGWFNPCAVPVSTLSRGQRSKTASLVTNYPVYLSHGWCHVDSETTLEDNSRKQSSVRTLTVDKKNVASQTVFGQFDTGGITTSATYFASGEIETQTDPLGNVTRSSNYKRGMPQTETHPIDPSNTIAINRVIDDLGRVSSETDGENRTASFTYNGQHHPISITPPRGASLAFGYSGAEDTISRGSRLEKVTYDGFGRVLSHDNAGLVTTYRYDVAGRRTFVSYPGSTSGQRVEYDALDRPTKLYEPDPMSSTGEVVTTIEYNDSLSQIRVTNPNGGVTTLTMEAFGDPSDAWVKKRELPGGAGTIEYTRNVFGQVEKIRHTSGDTPPVVVERTMKYDADRGYYLIEETHPELGLIKYDRDANGNMIGRTVGSSGKTTYSYDGQNRLVTVTPPPGDTTTPTITRTWYKTGKPKSVVAGGVSRNYTFDENDNLLSETLGIDGVTRALSYAYDSLDSLQSITYPSGRISELAPDLLGRATKATPFVTSATHHPSGMLKEITFANGTKQNFAEQTRRPIVAGNRIVNGSSAALLDLAYGFDKNANMLSILEPTASAQFGYARNATYDAFDRIKSIGNEAFDYVGIGDFKTTKNLAGLSSTFNYNLSTRRLDSISGAVPRTYGYDAYGNVSTDGRGFTYAYDAYSTLRSTTGGSANSLYVYDGHQHMAKQTTGGLAKYFLYGMNGRLFGEYPSAGTNATGSREYFYLSGKMVGQTVKE